MSTYTTDIAAVAQYRINDRVRDAEARRVARAVRAARAATEPYGPNGAAPAPSRPPRRRNWFTRRALA